MSLARLAMRLAAARAVKGVTLAGDRVFDSAIDAIDLTLAENRQPILHQESLYVPDRFEYRMTLSRTSVGQVAKWTPTG